MTAQDSRAAAGVLCRRDSCTGWNAAGSNPFSGRGSLAMLSRSRIHCAPASDIFRIGDARSAHARRKWDMDGWRIPRAVFLDPVFHDLHFGPRFRFTD